MSTYCATATVHIDNRDTEDEASDIKDLLVSALRATGYYAYARVTAHPYAPISEANW